METNDNSKNTMGVIDDTITPIVNNTDDTPKNKKRGRKPKSKNYLTNLELQEELEKCHLNDKVSDKLALMYMKITEGLQTQFKYTDPQDKEDCLYGSLEVFMKNWKCYDMERGRPFPFFTRMAYNAIYATWNKLKLTEEKKKGYTTVSYDAIFTEEI